MTALPLPLPPVPSVGRCLCGAPLWYVRPRRIGEDGRFRCRRCGREYRETPHWIPGDCSIDVR